MNATHSARAAPLRSWTGPALVGAGAMAACALVLAVDPRSSVAYPSCPFLAATGYWCPLCGGLRAVRSALEADVAAAMGYHAPLVIALPVLVYVWLAWVLASTGREPLPLPAVSRRARLVLGASAGLLLTAFSLLRNLAPFAALAPGG